MLRLAGKNSRIFPSRREFRRFSSSDRRENDWQIKASTTSRSNAKREFLPAQQGIKFAEPGIAANNAAQQDNQNRYIFFAPEKSDSK
jgi:hypothetical protein